MVRSTLFERFAGWCALLAGGVALLYSVAFLIITRSAPELGLLLSAACLLVGGLLGTVAILGLYDRLAEVDSSFARLGLLLSVTGALGSAIHGGYDLANALNPPTVNAANLANLPSAIDPRGLLTFGVAGLGLLVTAWLMSRSPSFPRPLSSVAALLAGLFLILYLGRLIVLTPTSPLILGPALLAGFVVNPAWLLWLGAHLVRTAHPAAAPRSTSTAPGLSH